MLKVFKLRSILMLSTIFVESFSELEDPRVERCKKHLLLDIIGLALLAVLAGAQGWTEIADFCEHHIDWLKCYFQLPNGIPSHDTFSRVFSILDVQRFQSSFLKWVRSILHLLPEEVIAIDGKSLCASRCAQKGLKALHIVSAWSCANGISLGQLAVDQKTNEIQAIPEILETIVVSDAVVTIDAMGCQKKIAQKIIECKGDYLLRIKANQSTWLQEAEAICQRAAGHDSDNLMYYEAIDQVNNDHGRLESRRCVVLPAIYFSATTPGWEGIRSVILLISQRETSVEHRYYLSSLPANQPERILKSIRSHWLIENHCHWTLDVVFREDQSTIRQQQSALNMAWLRKIALGLLKQATHLKGGIRRKQMAIWAKPQHLIDILKI